MATVERARSVADDPGPLLRTIGVVAAEYFREGFDKQGVVAPWSAPYGGTGEPVYVHVAGLVADLAKGRKPRPRRFEPGVAGSDTGALRQSIAARVVDDSAVEVGSTLPYAGRFHAGGESEQAITPLVRKGLSDLLRIWPRGSKRKGNAKRQGEGAERKRLLRARLGFLFATETLVTRVRPRPIVGWTTELQERITDAVREAME